MGLLTELGYTGVRDYPGGLTEWMDRGSPVATGALAPGPPARPAVIPAGDVRETSAGGGNVSAPRPQRPRLNWSLRFVDALGDQSVGELFRLWLAIIVAFAVAYWLLGWVPGFGLMSPAGPVASDMPGFLSALYFSAVTATSVGYGDIVPVGLQRLLAVTESVAGLVIFGCVISKFVSRRQEHLIAEIHRIAFEDRLGRVRTNLHLVRTEVQATARLCEGQDVAPADAVTRVESIAMVFVGELHAVHDLLYHPHLALDETVLEAILASLASVFREFHALLACAQVRRADRSGPLRSSLTTMARLAQEICGDCVPREYAPALRRWMDEIQRMARAIGSQP